MVTVAIKRKPLGHIMLVLGAVVIVVALAAFLWATPSDGHAAPSQIPANAPDASVNAQSGETPNYEVTCTVNPQVPKAYLQFQRTGLGDAHTIEPRNPGASEAFEVTATVTNNTGETIANVFVEIGVVHENRGLVPEYEGDKVEKFRLPGSGDSLDIEAGDSTEFTGVPPLFSAYPGEGWVVNCEAREDRFGPDRSLDTSPKEFTIAEDIETMGFNFESCQASRSGDGSYGFDISVLQTQRITNVFSDDELFSRVILYRDGEEVYETRRKLSLFQNRSTGTLTLPAEEIDGDGLYTYDCILFYHNKRTDIAKKISLISACKDFGTVTNLQPVAILCLAFLLAVEEVNEDGEEPSSGLLDLSEQTFFHYPIALRSGTICVGDQEDCQRDTESPAPGTTPGPAGCTRDLGTWTGTVSVSGLWSEDCESEAGSGRYARYYTFSLDEESELAVTLESSEADPYLYLRSGDATSGSTLADNDDVDPDGGNTNSEIVRTLDAGTYTIEATTSNEGETGRFTLTLSEPETATTPPLAGNCVQTVSASATVTDQWASGCASETRSGRYARFYAFALDQESEVAITLESSDADTYLYLRSGSETTGSVLHENDNHEGSTSRSQIQETLAAGTYTIEATTYDPGITGSFTLTISGLEATTQPPTTPEVGCFQDLGVLIETTTVAEAWTGECPSPHWYGRYARHYTFILLRELELRVGLISTEDAFLFLLHGADPDGALVAGNDDVSSGNTNSYIARTLAAGTYTIEATTRDEGIIGNFTLTIDPRDIPTIPLPPRPTPPSPSEAFDRNAAGDFTSLARNGNDLPVGIWSDWATVWVADETDDKLYAYDMKTKARVADKDFDTPAAAGNNHLAGIWSDSDTMWVADYSDARVYAYHAESKARHIAEEFGGLRSAGNANPTGIWSDGATMWVADSVDKKIYAYNMRTKAPVPEKYINTLNAAGNHHPQGLWSNGKTMWVADYSDDKVYAYDLTTKAQMPGKDFETLNAAGNNEPYGIWSDGATMLVSDHRDDRLYAYNMPPATDASTAPPRPVADTEAFDRNAAGDFNNLASNGNDLPVGIWSDWATVWVADETDDKLYAYDMKTKARVADKDFDTPAAAGNNHLAGIWSDSDTMWVADYSDARVYAYHAESKARHIAEEFGGLRSAGNANPTGIWSDGATMWVADSVDKKIYAYNMRTKAPVPEKYINTLNAAGNHHPQGLWSNGKTMWVADYSDDKVYAYDLTTKAQMPGKDFETLNAAGNNEPYGIWSDGATMLVSDHRDDRLYAYNMPPATDASTAPPRPVADTEAFDRNAAGDFNNLASNGNDLPVGIWSDWATVWVADETDDKLYAYDMKTKARVAGKDFDTPAAAGNNHLAGIWSDSDTMWVADYSDARVYAYHAESKAQHIAEEFGGLRSAGNANPTGIWSDGATMWVADSVDKKIYAYNMRTKAPVPEKYINTLNAAGNHHPQGLWSNGKTMWVADYSDDKVYAYDLTTKAQMPGKDFETLNAAGNNEPYGIWSDGATMLVSDHGDDRLYAYNMPPNLPVAPPRPVADTEAFDRNAAGDFTSLASNGNDLPVGIWSDWATVWVADETDDKLYAYDMKTKARVADKDFDILAAAGNNHLAGIWSDSDTMWVADYSDARVYAYHAESKAQHIAEEFGGLRSAGNANPTGIWSDGATMWVADSVDKKIYAYNMRTKAPVPEKYINTLNAAGNHHPQGLWSNGKTMWVADYSDDKVYAYDLTTKAQMPGKDFETLNAAGNNEPYGIWSDGATMLVSDHRDDRLYAYNMPPATDASTAPPRPVADTEAFDRNAAGDFNNLASNGNDLPVGIWSDWATVWVADETDDKLYAYDMKTKARVAGKDFDTPAAAGNNHLAGIWSDSDTMWVADYSDARVYAYHAESKARHIAEEFGGLRSAGNTNPTGIWSDGATMWVADSVDKKIYAYNMRTKAPVPEKYINTLNAAGNHHPQGLWSNGKTMWVADYSDDKVYAYDLTTKAQMPGKDFETLNAAGNNEPYGIWSDGATMLVSDHGDDRLYAYNMPPSLPVAPPRPVADTEAFDRNAAGDFTSLARNGNDLPVGIWSDWATVWVADETDDKLYAYDMKTKARVAGKDFDILAAAGNNHLAGIWSDSDTMWVADYSDARVYAYHAESKVRHIAEEFGGLRSAGNANPTGIWSDGATMWVADSVDKKIYAYNMRTKAPVPEKYINTLNAAGNHHPQGLWSNGKTMWVADYSDDKVYAYDLTTKAQMPGKDFETLNAAGNNEPYGIWSDGATMLVSDHRDDRLYAYNMPPNLPVAPPGMPAIGSVSPGASSLTVSWSVPSGAPGGITAYDLRHIRTDADETVDANWTVEDDAWTTGSGALQYVLTGLNGGTQYDVQVRAVSSAGYGPWSTTVTGTPETTGPPPTSGASRTFSSVSVDPADELTVTITAPGSFTGQVVETLPPGFSYVASSLSDSAVAVEGQIVTFTLLGDASFTYTVTASSVEGVYSFDGVLTPFGGEELPIGGDSTVTVGSAPMVYLSLDDSLPLMVRIGSPLPVIATFTEAVSDFTLDDITVLNGTVGNFLADAEGIVYTFDVTPDAVAKVTVDIATGVAMDSEGNGNTAAAQLSFIPYDDDGVEGISKSEAIAAIRDYFDGNLDKAQAIAVIRLYFASGS